MTPVTRGIPDAEKNRQIFPPGLFQSLGSPGKPVHGVPCMGEQIRAGFAFKTIQRSTPLSLMQKMPHAGENHGYPVVVAGLCYLVVADGTPGLYDRPDTCFRRGDGAVTEREESIAGQG